MVPLEPSQTLGDAERGFSDQNGMVKCLRRSSRSLQGR